MVYIEVRDGNLDSALRFIRRKLQRDGYFKAWRSHAFHETSGEKNRRVRHDIARRVQRANRTYSTHGRNVNIGSSVEGIPLDLIYQPELLASYMKAKFNVDSKSSDAAIESLDQIADNDSNESDSLIKSGEEGCESNIAHESPKSPDTQ